MPELEGIYPLTFIRAETSQPLGRAACLSLYVVGEPEFIEDETTSVPGREATLDRDGVGALRDLCNRFLGDGRV